MNLIARFETVFAARADQNVFITDDGTWTYADLDAAVGRYAGALVDAGVSAGDRVVVQVEKSLANVALYLGCLKCGGVYVPVNPGYTAQEVDYFVGDTEPTVFVGEKLRDDVTSFTLDADGNGTMADAAAAASTSTTTVERTADDLAAILYTSGTTGRSKGAQLTHGNLTSNAETLVDYWGWQPDDVLLHALPIFHVHGLFVALHCVFLTGTSLIFQPRFDIDALLEALPRSTVLMGVPTFYSRLVADERFTAQTCSSMRLFISGSAPLTEQTFEAFEERTGMKILERYGMSETLMNTSNPLDGDRVAGTVGFPLPGVEARITDDDGNALAANYVGGIEVRGPNVFTGYWRMPEKTAEEFRADGWFKTGDLGVMDEEGRVSIVGREKDLVISGGFNVYPKEVERLIDEMPGVVESAVIGVPHGDFGEAVVAVVVPNGAAIEQTAVDAYLKDHLARYKQPKRVISVEALPRNAMGKVQKKELRDTYESLFS